MNVATSIEVRPAPEVVSAFQLLRDFKPIESIVDGLPTGRGALVSVTGPTGHGKTTVLTLLQIALCRGLKFAGREVTQGSVLVLAGENPDDYTMRLAATAQDLGLRGAELARPPPMGELLVISGTFSVPYEFEVLRQHFESLRTNLVAVFVDTSAAFYGGDDENDNVAMRRHASALRELTTLPGRPTVFVLCHPTKNAQRDSLLPRGGGAFLAEVDANLTLWKDEAGIITLHWSGKIRGPSFEPVRFELVPIELEPCPRPAAAAPSTPVVTMKLPSFGVLGAFAAPPPRPPPPGAPSSAAGASPGAAAGAVYGTSPPGLSTRIAHCVPVCPSRAPV